jgi:hypothetical protein
MNLDDLEEHVWRRLPMRKYMAGRTVVRDLTLLAVENWEGEYLGHATSEEGRDIVGMSITARVKRAHQLASGKDVPEYGVLWTLLLSAVVGQIVRLLIEWWMERSSHRVMMAGWQQEMTR